LKQHSNYDDFAAKRNAVLIYPDLNNARKIFMKKIIIPIAAALLYAPFFSSAQNAPQGAVMTAKGPGEAVSAEAVQLQGKVKSIDKQNRTVVVVGQQGKEVVLTLGPEARNFDQINVGDLVTLTYVQALALELRKSVKGGALGQPITSEQSVRAKPGDKPAAAIERTTNVTANVIAVNQKTQIVTLKGPNRTVELKVKDPAMLKDIKVGNQVEATFTEAIGIEVTAAPKK
jgi:Cu/Ag efflux protein CusF